MIIFNKGFNGKRFAQCTALLCGVLVLTSCARHERRFAGVPAPVVERGMEMIPKEKAKPEPTKTGGSPLQLSKEEAAAETLPHKIIGSKNYIVQKGDTMFSIAFFHGVELNDLAEYNHITDPTQIRVGQELRIPLYAEEAKPVAAPPTAAGGMKMFPKTGKVPYSANAMALAQAMQGGSTPASAPLATVPPVAPAAAKAAEPPPISSKAPDGEDALAWGMPTQGKVISGFSEGDNLKGVDIAGKLGQAVVASADGKVVYSGSGLRGYGKLVIIKHNKTYLSAYAHNDRVLVKEGQSVDKGEKIAEMGKTDADQVKLHFEIRKFGKSVDPAQFLPSLKP